MICVLFFLLSSVHFAISSVGTSVTSGMRRCALPLNRHGFIQHSLPAASADYSKRSGLFFYSFSHQNIPPSNNTLHVWIPFRQFLPPFSTSGRTMASSLAAEGSSSSGADSRTIQEELNAINQQLEALSPVSGGTAVDSLQFEKRKALESRAADITSLLLNGEDGASNKDASRDSSVFSLLRKHNIPIVQLDEGICKYVLILVHKKDETATGDKKAAVQSNDTTCKASGKGETENPQYLVRSRNSAKYHYQAAMDTLQGLEKLGLVGEVQGGGRINLDSVRMTVEIYGYSYQFGKADHRISSDLVKEDFGDEYSVKWGDHGY